MIPGVGVTPSPNSQTPDSSELRCPLPAAGGAVLLGLDSGPVRAWLGRALWRGTQLEGGHLSCAWDPHGASLLQSRPTAGLSPALLLLHSVPVPLPALLQPSIPAFCWGPGEGLVSWFTPRHPHRIRELQAQPEGVW